MSSLAFDMSVTVGVIGCGNMAGAVVRTAIKAGRMHANQLVLMNSSVENCKRKNHDLLSAGATALNCMDDLLSRCKVIILGIKPQHITDIGNLFTYHGDVFVISLLAGIKTDYLGRLLGFSHLAIARAIPNMPCMIGCGVTALAFNEHCEGNPFKKAATTLLEAIGIVEVLPERLFDAVTGLSGSGPAYVYIMCEALADGGVRAGLPRSIAQRFAAHTMVGAAKMVLESGEAISTLKDTVCSPGGTTISGVHALEEAGIRAGLMNAVMASANRALELQQ